MKVRYTGETDSLGLINGQIYSVIVSDHLIWP